MIPDDPKPLSPGIALREFLRPRGITAKALAAQIGKHASFVSDVMNDRRRITPDMAVRLALALDTSAEFWLRLQCEIDIWKVDKINLERYAAIKPFDNNKEAP